MDNLLTSHMPSPIFHCLNVLVVNEFERVIDG